MGRNKLEIPDQDLRSRLTRLKDRRFLVVSQSVRRLAREVGGIVGLEWRTPNREQGSVVSSPALDRLVRVKLASVAGQPLFGNCGDKTVAR